MGKSSATTTETIDIETSGNSVALELNGRTHISLAIRGDSAASYVLDARKVGGTWRKDVGKTFSGNSDYSDVLRTGAEEVRVRCSSGSGTPDDSADIDLMGAGG